MANSVVTIPIKTSQADKDLLDKRFNLVVTIYNHMLSNRLKMIKNMEDRADYASATAEISWALAISRSVAPGSLFRITSSTQASRDGSISS